MDIIIPTEGRMADYIQMRSNFRFSERINNNCHTRIEKYKIQVSRDLEEYYLKHNSPTV